VKTDSYPGSPEELHLDQQFCHTLYFSSQLVTGLYRTALEPLGLTFPQYLVLLALWEHGQQSMGELERRLGLDSSTLTPVTKRMAAAGLLERRRDATDERRVLLESTPAGWALQERALDVRRRVVCGLPLSADDLDQLRTKLQQMNGRLVEERKERRNGRSAA
jgi:MarR family transcriptional regulator, organic hydroperoxide resistance regulator